jgi:hypothetical protein
MKVINSIVSTLAATAALSSTALAFSPAGSPNNSVRLTSQLEAEAQTRGDFLSTAAAAVVTGAAVIASPIQPAQARGRATLEAAYDRYCPRIIDGGKFYKSNLYGAISKSDWKTIATATTNRQRNPRRIDCWQMEVPPNAPHWQEGSPMLEFCPPWICTLQTFPITASLPKQKQCRQKWQS